MGLTPPDLAAGAVATARILRSAGIPVTPERSARFARALDLAGPVDPERLYWLARVVFVSSVEQLEAFDRVFGRLARAGVSDPATARGDSSTAPGERGAPTADEGEPGAAGSAVSLVAGLAASARSGDAEPGRDALLAAASAEERLGEKRFEDLAPEELAEVRRLMRSLALAAPVRRSRRLRRDRRGERIDLRTTLRRSRRTGGDPVRWARRRRSPRRRRLVLLLDVSGSMEPYSRALLQFLDSGVTGASAEAFVFATRLTRLTRTLRGGGHEAALRRAAAAAPDWSGGTRIGSALKAFNDGYGRRGLARGAVVVILSDGWEAGGEPAAVAREMERLHRLAHRIVWVNPRAAAPGFEPLAEGMAAALPFCDVLLSGHSASALEHVVEAIGAEHLERRDERWISTTSSRSRLR